MILGAVLAGGQSRRFGKDKALAFWKGKTLLDHAVSNLEAFVTTTIICGRASFDVPSVMDYPSSGLGPLGGLNAALHYAANAGYARVITTPCDAPGIAPHLLAALLAVQGDAFLANMPVIGSWRSECAPALDRYLANAGSRSVRGWATSICAIPLDLPPPPNINRPEDLESLGE